MKDYPHFPLSKHGLSSELHWKIFPLSLPLLLPRLQLPSRGAFRPLGKCHEFYSSCGYSSSRLVPGTSLRAAETFINIYNEPEEKENCLFLRCSESTPRRRGRCRGHVVGDGEEVGYLFLALEDLNFLKTGEKNETDTFCLEWDPFSSWNRYTWNRFSLQSQFHFPSHSLFLPFIFFPILPWSSLFSLFSSFSPCVNPSTVLDSRFFSFYSV